MSNGKKIDHFTFYDDQVHKSSEKLMLTKHNLVISNLNSDKLVLGLE